MIQSSLFWLKVDGLSFRFTKVRLFPISPLISQRQSLASDSILSSNGRIFSQNPWTFSQDRLNSFIIPYSMHWYFPRPYTFRKDRLPLRTVYCATLSLTEYLDAIDGLYQMGNNPLIVVAVIGNIVSIAFFNFFGLSVTKTQSATTRMVLDSIRTIVIWAVCLALGWEEVI